MDRKEILKLYGFYENELTNNILSFWVPRCVDQEFGGFLNCFDNRGENLVSHDKYIWSQGRFVWLFARLSLTEAPVFSKAQRGQYLTIARQGAEFLMDHCLIGPDDWRCVFLLNRDGSPKQVSPGAPLDMSIYADCFVIAGLAAYALASGEEKAYRFAKTLYQSAAERVRQNTFRTLPYPLSAKYRAHGIPMIFSNITRELLLSARRFEPDYCGELTECLELYARDSLEHFTDQNDVLREVVTCENAFFPRILGEHINPGHILEDVWFLMDAAETCSCEGWLPRIYRIALHALEKGWDQEYGGLLHYAGMEGGQPLGDDAGVKDEPMTQQLSGWNDKIWWIHSEALYATLRCYFTGGDSRFLQWHDRIFDYTFHTFPNRNPEIREWIQIRTQDGSPQEKVVALPVKDPYHIARNLILILELLMRAHQAATEALA